MLIFKMALKNIFRYKKRTFITAAAIAAGLVFYIFIDSLLLGWYGSTENQYIQYEVASGRVVNRAWWEDKDRMPPSRSIEDPSRLTSLFDELGIEYTPRTEFAADLIFYKDPFPADGSYPVKAVALDPSTDGKIFRLADSMKGEFSRGEFVESGDEGIVVGNALADKLNMELGYPVRLQFSGKYGYQEILDTRIKGIVKTGAHLVNLRGVFLSLDTADTYLEMEGAVTGYAVKVPGGRKGSELLAELKTRLPEDLLLLNYSDLASDFVALQQVEDSFVSLFIFLIFIIAAVGISNTMMMAIFERRREIGMMRAQGFPDRKIQLMFFLEAGGIGLLGTAAGLFLGALVNIPLVNTGLNYGALLNAEGDFLDFGGMVIDSRMKGLWSLKSFLTGGILAVIVSSLVAWFPSHRMLRKEIPDNLRMD